jgi:hypothetical protein
MYLPNPIQANTTTKPYRLASWPHRARFCANGFGLASTVVSVINHIPLVAATSAAELCSPGQTSGFSRWVQLGECRMAQTGEIAYTHMGVLTPAKEDI